MEYCNTTTCQAYDLSKNGYCRQGGHANNCDDWTYLTTQKEPVADVTCNDGVIKPCPFCGNDVEVKTGKNAGSPRWYWIHCDCEATRQHMVESRAIEEWNKRAI